MSLRAAASEDINRMVELSDVKRAQYARYSPVFWRKADGASKKQRLFFQAQLARENNIVLVSKGPEGVEGFLIASVVGAPPVYDPGGKVCMVDDFAVSAPELWQTVGQALLSEATAQAKSRGAVLSVVVCGQGDEPKRAMLRTSGASIASEWYTNLIP